MGRLWFETDPWMTAEPSGAEPWDRQRKEWSIIFVVPGLRRASGSDGGDWRTAMKECAMCKG